MRQFIDRHTDIVSLDTTNRDSRRPISLAKALKNITLRDGRIARRNKISKYSNKEFKSTQLGKHTSTFIQSGFGYNGTSFRHGKFFRCSNSYALIKHDNNTGLTCDNDTSIEFILTLGKKEELVSNPWKRSTNTLYDGDRLDIRPNAGVFVIDRSILAREFVLNYNSNQITVEHPKTGALNTDIWCLTNYAVAYDDTSITFMYDVYNDADGAFEKNFTMKYYFNVYQEGEQFHISITYAASTRELKFYVNGILIDSNVLPEDHKFICDSGVELNGLQTSLKIDTVILNEFTVRGGLASSIYPVKNAVTVGTSDGAQIFDSYPNNDSRPEPLAHSPPQGTGISELRYWTKALTNEEIENNIFLRIDDVYSGDDLYAYFPLNNINKVIKSSIGNLTLSLHSCSPGLSLEEGLLNGYGLYFSEGQHLIREFDYNDYLYVDPAHAALNEIFAGNTSSASGSGNSTKEFTIQVQLKTPHSFNGELTKRFGAPQLTGIASDSRDSMSVKAFGLADGKNLVAGLWAPVRDENGTAVTTTQQRFHRAFDQTIFSIENNFEQNAADSTGYTDNSRVVVCRGLITPSGQVAFEFFGWDNDVSTKHAREFRLVSDTILDTNEIYELSFRKSVVYYVTGGQVTPYGYKLDILINGVVDKSLTIGDGSASADITIPALNHSVMHSLGVRDIIIGASYVNNILDRSIASAASDSITLTYRVVPQHKNSPYQDQPGNFTLGYFRIWNSGISNEEINLMYGKSAADFSKPGLISNVEINEFSGDSIGDSGNFSGIWNSGFKSWGFTQYKNNSSESLGSLGWAAEDCLGAIGCENIFDDTECRFIGFYSKTLDQEFGITTIFDGSAYYDINLDGAFKQIFAPNIGLTSKYNDIFNSVVIADRQIITSNFGSPLIFNGINISNLGFKKWTGGNIIAYSLSSGGSLIAGKWYGVCIAYFSEKSNIYHVSPVTVVKIGAGHNAIKLEHISQHPDIRVSAIILGITLPQDTQELAQTSTLFGHSSGYLPNAYYLDRVITASSGDNIIIPHPLSFTPPPQCSLCASYDNRLWLAGDKLIPDILYRSDIGNIEKFDTLVNRSVLEEGSGDVIISLLSIFSALYVLKNNSVWRVVTNGVDSYDISRIFSIGPVSSKAVQIVTIPDSGRNVVVIWSKSGPYLFDEVNLNYIGKAIEGTNYLFNDIEHESVVSVHDKASRNIIFIFNKIDSNEQISFVYNYGYNTWSSATGIPGKVALNIDIAKNSGLGSIIFNPLSILGSNNFLYKLDNAPGRDVVSKDFDSIYIEDIVLFDGKYYGTLTAYENEVPVIFDDNELKNSSITIVVGERTTWYTGIITQNTGNQIQFDIFDGDLDEPSYLEVYIGQPLCEIEFPWDQLNFPYVNKQINRLVLWLRSRYIFYSLAKDYSNIYEWSFKNNESTSDIALLDDIDVNVESVKLRLASPELDFRLDSMAYAVTVAVEASRDPE